MYDTESIRFSCDEIMTLDEIAKALMERHGWLGCRVDDAHSKIVFKAKDGDEVKEGYVGPSGFAYRLEESEDEQFEENDPWPEHDVDWDEDLGYNNHVWGEDDQGLTVLVHD